ncbi:MAG: hypothetical protein K9J27_00470 [Bacteroidales bacterium]|nr:hypothetical protein [Bacteroidales bacterium]MCF8332787.1 hypothetical protein [Bacteroidales bacterium]
MKHFLIILLVSSSFMYAKGQETSQEKPSKNQYLIETNFGYSYDHKDSPDTEGPVYNDPIFGVITSDFSVSLNLSKKFKTQFRYGIGASFNRSKKEINPESDVPEPGDGSTGWNNSYIGYTNSVTQSTSFSPMAFVQYSKKLADNFSLTFDLYSRYDFVNEEVKRKLNSQTGIYVGDSIDYGEIIGGGGIIGNDSIGNGNGIPVSSLNSEQTTEKHYFNLGLIPSFRYQMFDNAGVDFSFGLLQYRHKVKDSRNDQAENRTSEFRTSFAPENWTIGFWMTF